MCPGIVIGHSIGEVAAACIAGGMSIETAMLIAVTRGRMMQALPAQDGVMVAVRTGAADVESALDSLDVTDKSMVGIAAVNAPASCVISGKSGVVSKVLKRMDRDGIFVDVSHAFHSPLMQPMENHFRVFLSTLKFAQLRVPLASTVTGEIILPGEQINIEHWVTQLAGSVLFSDALAKGLRFVPGESIDSEYVCKIAAIVELGPSPVLTRMSKPWVQTTIFKKESVVWACAIDKKN